MYSDRAVIGPPYTKNQWMEWQLATVTPLPIPSNVTVTEVLCCDLPNSLLSSSKTGPEVTSLLSDPAQLGAVYSAEVQEGQGGGSMWMWPPFK